MVRPDVDPNDLEEAPMSDWDANELPDAHPEWSGPNPLESVEQARARVRKMGAHFWRLALDWTRANGPICDVQLRGYTRDGGVLFEEGKRCNLAAGSRRSTSASEGLPVVERERVEPRREPTEHERERLEHERDFQARREARLMADVHQIHHTYGDLLGSLKRERDEAMGLTQETIRLVPDLFAEASKVIRDSLDHHRAQVRETVANATGKREYEFHAYSEQQETARHDRTIGFLIEAVQVGVGMLGPLASQIIETMRGRARAAALSLMCFSCGTQAVEEKSPTPAEKAPAVQSTTEQRPDRVVREVFSGDRRLGIVAGQRAWTLEVYDDTQQLLFSVDETTGNICPTSVVFYATPDCTGQMYAMTELMVDECLQAPPPIRRKVTALPSMGTCFSAPKTVLVPSGEPVVVPRLYARSDWDPGATGCYEHNPPPEWDPEPPQHCAIPLDSTSLLPLTFPVPLTIR
jgi:hypothetical protein